MFDFQSKLLQKNVWNYDKKVLNYNATQTLSEHSSHLVIIFKQYFFYFSTNFSPSSAPSLQNNMDRLNSLLYDFSSDIQEPAHRDYTPQPVMTATAVYKFEPRSARFARN